MCCNPRTPYSPPLHYHPPQDKSWGAAQKLMNNVDKFLDRLKGFKAVIDEGKVAKKTVGCV
jgi:hypothetical protein